MTTEPVSAMTAVAALSGESSSASVPTAQQAARFAQQVQEPASIQPGYYEPVSVSAAEPSRLTGAMGEVSQLAARLRTQTEALERPAGETVLTGRGAGGTTEPFLQQMALLRQLGYSSMNVSLISSAERLLNENVRSLYQLA